MLATVDAVMSCAFAWGGCDCVGAASAVFAALHGRDPLEGVSAWRGPAEAMRIIKAGGGLERLATAQARRLGLREGHAIGGLAVSVDARTLLVCIQPGIWAGKTKTGFAIMRQAGRGWYA
ncbi:DUF6950 family protein [Gemmobacter serpentinus]|uniref:DUF6950 family protein n=1 Tax=Gemmobacter serpentinus TaxID=2652247 RepID=UPI00384ECE2F